MPKASEKKRLAKQESTDKERSPYEVQFYYCRLDKQGFTSGAILILCIACQLLKFLENVR